MSRKLLDTTFLVHYWTGRERAEEYLAAHEETSTFVTTSINMKEIAVGRALQGQLDRQEILSTFNWVTIVPFEMEHGLIAGELEAELRRNDEINQDKINSVIGDLLIASVAKGLDAAVVTRNRDDFALFEGLDIDTY